MNDSSHELVEALRDELRQYGTLMGLLEQQQTFIIERRTQDLLQAIDAVNAQSITVELVRHTREQCHRRLAASLGLSEDTPFSAFASRLSLAGRTMIPALVNENNLALNRIHQRARQNQVLLRRALELMQQFTDRLFPSIVTPGYDGSGRRMAPVPASRRYYEAVV